MRDLRLVLAAVAVLCLTLMPVRASDGAGAAYRIFSVGQTCCDPQVQEHMIRMAEADGLVLEFGHMDSPPGVRELGRTIRAGRWDAVVLGQAYADMARPLMHRLRRCRVLVRMDWAYARNYLGDVAVVPEFAELYGCDQAAMYDDLVQAARSLSGQGVEVIAVGTAVQNVRATWDRDNITADGVRLNRSMGCYVEACTWYETLLGRDVRDSSYDPGRLWTGRLALARDAAHAAVEHPWEVSDFGYRTLTKIYDEALVPGYTLPDALVMQDGRPVVTARQWYEERRPELLDLFESQMYGRAPSRPEGMHFSILSEDRGAMGGTAIRKEIRIYFTPGEEHYMTLLLYVPKHVEGPVPVFLGANFLGNATVNADPMVHYADEEQIQRYALYSEHPRGERHNRWPLGMILSRGYALATFHKSDLAPEFDSGFSRGVFPLFYRGGQDCPDADQWGNIAAWAWGYSRALDYLETDPDVDASRVATIGHSRLAKTALWAAVEDQRFAMAIPNNPGCCGAAITRRAYGESLETIVRHYHYWFCANLAQYVGREDELPFDQHELIALMAPRPVCVGSGEHDRWSDPKGEFIALREASRVYEFLGLPGLGLERMPGPWKPQHEGLIGYHMRSGPHEITAYDWAQYLDFADKWLAK